MTDYKQNRQAHTSPIPNKSKAHESKNSSSKGALKRNLFREFSGVQSPAVLAKQLEDSPLKNSAVNKDRKGIFILLTRNRYYFIQIFRPK